MNAYRNVILQLARKNTATATAAVEKLQLTDDQRQTLTDIISKTQPIQPNPDMYTN